ncbi:MAG TPA: TIGR00282 family metallophosphoesterase [Candidatus Polarisedimenticolia bacterium]|nr:TIGR00282 family metallophosphoesterase [Candidatus Polarisedimenticolia bacterium]
MRILAIGDVNGRAGRRVLQSALPRLIVEHAADLVVANVENAADGFGVTPDLAEQMLAAGIDCMTSGNHIWDKPEIVPYLQESGRLLRPDNYPAGAPGRGVWVGATPGGVPVAVINLMGRVFMPPCDDPFRAADQALKAIAGKARVVLVDMHAEASSEKQAMAVHLDGRVSAVFGTHTHVPTADERILVGGTAYITDLGMTGPYDSVIGVEKELALRKFRTGMPVRFAIARRDTRLCGALFDIDESSGRARGIERIMVRADAGAGGAGDADAV